MGGEGVGWVVFGDRGGGGKPLEVPYAIWMGEGRQLEVSHSMGKLLSVLGGEMGGWGGEGVGGWGVGGGAMQQSSIPTLNTPL
jgi:hypothetical protein